MRTNLYRIFICLMFAVTTMFAQTSAVDTAGESGSVKRCDSKRVVKEIARVDPLPVSYEADGVKYDIGVVLLNALSEQQAQIKSQSEENATLREQIAKLRAEIDALRVFIVCRTSMRPELCVEPGK